MARPLRIEYPNAWYHVMNRGRRGEDIFSAKEDYEMFVVVLQEAAELFCCRIAAYCLMPNHYHLLVQTPQGNLSRIMRHVSSVYTQRFNRRQQTAGQLFRGRYKSILVEEDSYLLELLRYIHRNPVRAGLSKTVAEYQWSSHKGYVSPAGKWDWLYRELLLGMFADKPDNTVKAYRQFVQKEDSSEILDFCSSQRPASILGSEDFVEKIKAEFHELKR
ncbi:MAG: transposase, partial [Desulfobia sp.]